MDGKAKQEQNCKHKSLREKKLRPRMGSDTEKPLTDEDVVGKMLAELKRMATELEFGSIEFACKVHVDHEKVKQIDVGPYEIVKRFR